MTIVLVPKKRGISIFALFLFFIVLSKSVFVYGENLLVDNRISGDLFLPNVGKGFDPQPFISKGGEDVLRSFGCNITNTNNYIPSGFEVDAESYVCNLGVEGSVSKNIRVHGDLSLVSAGGGVFDSWIGGWHDFFSLPNGYRGATRDNQFAIRGEGEDGNKFDIAREDLGLLDPKIYTSYILHAEGSDGFFSFNTGLSLPLQLSQFGTRLPNLLAGVSYQNRYEQSAYTLGADLTCRLDKSDMGLDYDVMSYGFYAGWNYLFAEELSFITNSYFLTNPLNNIRDYPSVSWYVDFGLRTSIILNYPLEILIRENFYTSRGTADVSLILNMLKF